MEKKIFITSGTSYLGLYLTMYFLENGWKVKIGMPANKIEERANRALSELSITYLKKHYTRRNAAPGTNTLVEMLETVRMEPIPTVDFFSKELEDCEAVIHSIILKDKLEEASTPDLINESMRLCYNLMSSGFLCDWKRILFIGDLSSVYSGYGKKLYSEEDKGDFKKMGVRQKICYLTEQLIWDFNKEHNDWFDITFINLGMLLGPLMAPDPKLPSVKFIRGLLTGNPSQIYKIQYPVIDVRDAALVILSFVNNEKTHGQRINVFEGIYWVREFVAILQDEFKSKDFKVAESEISGISVLLLSLFDKDAKIELTGYGKSLNISNKLFKSYYNEPLRYIDESLIEMASDQIDKGGVILKSKEKIQGDKPKKDVSLQEDEVESFIDNNFKFGSDSDKQDEIDKTRRLVQKR